MPFPAQFRYERLTSQQCAAIRAAWIAGQPATDLAQKFGVAVRTVYRILERESQPRVTVQVADWRTEFAVTDEGPVQVDRWRPAS